MQSLIEIASVATGVAVGGLGHDFAYHDVPLSTVHNGHRVQLNCAPGRSMSISDRQYDFLNFHFHVPSEHTMDGKGYPAEPHFAAQG